MDKIRAALMTALAASPKLVSDSLVSIEGTTFVPPNSGLWFETAFMPADSQPTTLGDGGMDAVTGIFQVSVCGRIGTSSAALLSLATQVRSRFVAGNVLNYSSRAVTILRTPVSTYISTEDTFKLPVSIYWRSLIPRPTLT